MRFPSWLSAAVALLVASSVVAPGVLAAAPAATFNPTSLNFGSLAIGTTSAAQSVTITNSGTANLFFNSVAVPNTLDYTVVNDGCSGLTLPPGGSCSMSITFKPTASGTRTAKLTATDNAPNSPQTAPLTGTGTGQNPPLAIMTQFFTCANGVCDVGANSNDFINNFFTVSFEATGGTAPYTFSGTTPAGEVLHSSGLMLGSPTTLGTNTFNITVTDAAGAKASQTFTLTVKPPPSPSPGGACQTGGVVSEALSGSAFNGQTPSGQATADETQFSGCGGFSTLSVSVNNVNLPDGSQIWVTLDFKPVGLITLSGGSGTMPTYNMGDFAVSMDAVRVYSTLPDVAPFQQILIGGSFVGGGGGGGGGGD